LEKPLINQYQHIVPKFLLDDPSDDLILTIPEGILVVTTTRDSQHITTLKNAGFIILDARV
jgi:hypothetical protein